MASSRAGSLPQVPECGQKVDVPETTKPLHFCRGFVLYGAAPGVEYLNNCMIYILFLFDTIIGYLMEYP
jgi:hypothetical protein